MNLKLITFSNNLCTIGKLYANGKEVCRTIEKAWKNNEPFSSCVPAGIYSLKLTNSPRYGEVYCLESESCDVSLCGDTKRTHILIHKANMASELSGCIAPVMTYGLLNNKYSETEFAGLSSGVAFNHLMQLLAGAEHTLEIERH